MPEEKILLVDDDPHILHTLSRFLTGQGYTVATASCGREALEALEAHRAQHFPLVILDLILPDVSGLDLLAHVRRNSPDTEVILFTGGGDLDSAIQALRLGAYDYLVKSELRLPELQSVVDRALERRRLTLSNRELLDSLRRAQEDLAATRARELAQIRRLGETLARPLAAQKLLDGLVELIWESLPLATLGFRFRDLGNLEAAASRHRPDLDPQALKRFADWLEGQLEEELHPTRENPGGIPLSPPPFAGVLQEKVKAGKGLGLVAAGREEPFSPEETELFRIFALQGEAALRNVLLFEEVKSLALRDGLTGLYNYRHFREVLAHQAQVSRRYDWPLSLLFLDIDNFKGVNDILGHPEGDLVLKTLARFLQTQVRQADVLCRYGGEEFVVLLPQTSGTQAHFLAERLRENIARTPIPLSHREIFITVSIGVARLTPGMEGEDLVKAADLALLQAKQTGKNRVCGPETG